MDVNKNNDCQPNAMICGSPSEDDDELISFDPMSYDFKVANIVSNYVKETFNRKDIPCKFHDGLSGKCWKGAQCQYGHKPYTGGIFAKENPVLSASANSTREVRSILNLNPEPILPRSTHLKCELVYVKSPSEFYVRPKHGFTCDTCKFLHPRNGNDTDDDDNRQPRSNSTNESEGTSMDDYDYGFGGLKALEGLCEDSIPKVEPESRPSPLSISKRLSTYLMPGERYRNYQEDMYFSKVELVAVRVNCQWNRALVRKCNKDNETCVHLLDTGEKLKVSLKDVCRLPAKFCSPPPEVYKCCISGVSPFMGHWTSEIIKKFKEMVDTKELVVIVENGYLQTGSFSIFEHCPYFVKVMISNNGSDEDISIKLVEQELALKWTE